MIDDKEAFDNCSISFEKTFKEGRSFTKWTNYDAIVKEWVFDSCTILKLLRKSSFGMKTENVAYELDMNFIKMMPHPMQKEGLIRLNELK
jgi:hypothetical protein